MCDADCSGGLEFDISGSDNDISSEINLDECSEITTDSSLIDGFEDLPFPDTSENIDTDADISESYPLLDSLNDPACEGPVNEDLIDSDYHLDDTDNSLSEVNSDMFSEMNDISTENINQTDEGIKVLTLKPDSQINETNETSEEEYLENMHRELTEVLGIPEGPELDLIMQNEQKGWEEIHGTKEDISETVPEHGDQEFIGESEDIIQNEYSDLSSDDVTDEVVEDDSGDYFDETNTENTESYDSETQEIEIDYDEIYGGYSQDYLSQGFSDINIYADQERLDNSLESFQQETWDTMTLDEQKQSMDNLSDYIVDAIGFENPPSIEYYNNPVDGDYGGYDSSTNTLSINEYMLGDSQEAADTVAHELWHAHQRELANNPQCERDYQYQFNFENYIPAELGQDAYQNQLIEAEARAFAEQFKDYNC